MNTATEINDTVKTADEETQERGYRPRLSFYHANGKGSGSAARFEVVPAGGDREGAVYLTLAQQKSVASGSSAQGNRQHATFDWGGRVTVKLNFGDLCQMLLVLRGQAANVAEGKGLYHDSRGMTTVINLNRNDDTHPGVTLDISRRSKDEAGQACRTRISFNSAEAFGLGAVLEQALGAVAFGNGAVTSLNRRDSSLTKPE